MAKLSKPGAPRKPRKTPAGWTRGRKTAAFLLCLGAVAAFVAAVSFDRLPSPIGDNAEFAILARSLAEGHGLRYLNHPNMIPATKYPPGFPLMLAAWIPLFGGSILMMKVVVAVCFVLLVPLTYLVARKFLGSAESVMAALLIATSAGVVPTLVGVVDYSNEVLSDVPYALFSIAGLLLLLDERRAGSRWAGIALVTWAFVVRTAGISLVAAAALYLFIRAHRREAVALVVACAAFSGLWALRNFMVAGEGGRYFQVLLAKNPYDPGLGTASPIDILKRMVINLDGYATGLFQENILPGLVGLLGGSRAARVTCLPLLGFVILGGYDLRRKALLANIYLLLYAATYLVWPQVWLSSRFMVPVAPIGAVYFVAGVTGFFGRLKVERFAALLICAAIAAPNIYSTSAYATRERGYSIGWVHYLSAAIWARDNTSKDSVFLCRSAFMFYIFSNRRTIQYPFTRDEDEMRGYLLKWHPSYIVVDKELGFPQTDYYLLPVLVKMEDMLQAVYSTPDPMNVIFRFTPAYGGP
jgi:hypothetical protein